MGRSILMLASLLAAFATTSASAAGPQVVAGSGTYAGAGEGLSSFTLGTSGAAGSDQFRIDAHGFFAGKLETTCTAFSGSRAVLVGELREPVEAFGELWRYAGLYLEDNGNGQSGQPDRVTAFVAFAPTPCAFLFAFGEQFALSLVTGNVVVKEGG